MKKKLLALLLVLVCVLSLTACTLVEDLYWELGDYFEEFDDDDYDYDDDYFYEDDPAPEHVHTFSQNNGAPATCTEDGITAQTTCSDCGYTEGGESIPALGHNWVTKPAQSATPTSVGYTAYEYCTRCGEVEGREEVQFVCTNHKLVSNPEKVATPSQNGHTAYKKCSICGLEQGKKETVFTSPLTDLLPSVYDRLSIFNLSETAKQEILGMYDAVMTFQGKYTFKSSVSKSQMYQYFRILAYSLPETMMIYGDYSYAYKGDKMVSITFPYAMTRDEYLTKATAVAKTIKPLLSAVEGKSDFEKLKYFHDHLVQKCTYTLEGDDVVNVYGALIDGINHCDGYSDAMNLLCNAAGVPCSTVLGYTSVYHAWNILQIGSRFYYVDIVCDDVDWYGKPLYMVFGVSSQYIESIGYSLDEYYTSVVPAATKDLNIGNRYMPAIQAGQDVAAALGDIAREIVSKKPIHIYIQCDGQAVYDAAKSNVHSYVTKAIEAAYPGAQITVLNKNTYKVVCMVVTYP